MPWVCRCCSCCGASLPSSNRIRFERTGRGIQMTVHSNVGSSNRRQSLRLREKIESFSELICTKCVPLLQRTVSLWSSVVRVLVVVVLLIAVVSAAQPTTWEEEAGTTYPRSGRPLEDGKQHKTKRKSTHKRQPLCKTVVNTQLEVRQAVCAHPQPPVALAGLPLSRLRPPPPPLLACLLRMRHAPSSEGVGPTGKASAP